MSKDNKRGKGTPLLGRDNTIRDAANKITNRGKAIDEAVKGKTKKKSKPKPKSKLRQGDKTGKSPKGIKKSPAKGKRELVALRKKQAERAKKMKKKGKKNG